MLSTSLFENLRVPLKMEHLLPSSAWWAMRINRSMAFVVRRLEISCNSNSITRMPQLSYLNRTIVRVRIFLTPPMLSSQRILHGKRRTSGLNQDLVHHLLDMSLNQNMMRLSLLRMRFVHCSETELQSQEILRFSIAPTLNLASLKKYL